MLLVHVFNTYCNIRTRHICDRYTHRQKLSNTTFFGNTVFEVAERNMWVIEITYFEFHCKFYYFYEHLELKMILLTKYLDNLRPFTKQVKNDKGKHEKSLKQMSEKSISV